MKIVLITVTVMLIVYVCYKTYSTSKVDNNLPALLAKNAIILDVRTNTEFEGGHIPGAINIPLGQLRTVPINIDTNRIIITCCSHGLRSIKALEILKNRGYKHAFNGGAWTDLEQYVHPEK